MTVSAPTQQNEPPQSLAAQTDRNKLLAAMLVVLKGLGIQLGNTASTATAGSATLPSNPVGFVQLTLTTGAVVKVPYYNI